METISLIIRVIIALGIFNVWLLRFNKASEWRGKEAKNMKEEFSVYGLPMWFMYVVGSLKILLAVGLIVSIWVPAITRFASLGIAVLMLGAFAMHLKVGDPLKKSLPAFILLFLALIVALV